MTTTFWVSVSQTVLFLAVCSFAWWVSRVIAEAANSSAEAADQAVKAASDAERTATDIRQMRDMLGTWLDQQQAVAESLLDLARQAQVGRLHEQLRTDTAEAQAVITPQAITTRSNSVGSAENLLGDASKSRRGRHANDADPRWTSALRTVASRTATRAKPQEE